MNIFLEPKFEDNSVADVTCQQFFEEARCQKNNNLKKISNGKIIKNQKEKFKLNKSKKNFLKKQISKDDSETLLNKKTINKIKTKQKNLITFTQKVKNGKQKIKAKSSKSENDNNVNEELLRTEIQSILNGGILDADELSSKKNFQETANDSIQVAITAKTPKTKKPKKKRAIEKEQLIEKDQEHASKNSKKIKRRNKLAQLLVTENQTTNEKRIKYRDLPLRQKMLEKLKAARFRYLNEQIYSTDSKEAQKIFNTDPNAFQAYHEGYRQQVSKWPLNPVDTIIKSIQKLPKSHIIADFGCGEAKLAKSVVQKVHSFDLVAANEDVQACDMAHVPLKNNSVDVVVFCLSLMGTNLHDYLLEANRVLKQGGILKIAEVESRFDDVNDFIEGAKRFNFKNTWKDLSHNLFYFLDFKKESNINNKKKLPTISLHPCLYKKR